MGADPVLTCPGFEAQLCFLPTLRPNQAPQPLGAQAPCSEMMVIVSLAPPGINVRSYLLNLDPYQEMVAGLLERNTRLFGKFMNNN